MPRASSEIVIDSARDDVFAFLADPENDPQWRSGVLDLKRVSGNGIGARYAQGVKGPGGRRIPADIEITELTPGESIAFQTVTGPVGPAVAMRSPPLMAGRACASNSRPT
ncbi:MAG: SRPBCC family protein [Solirubrobacterales bacterium]|nr:SRPBCC family protein [Solirubrobacterales bacterium]